MTVDQEDQNEGFKLLGKAVEATEPEAVVENIYKAMSHLLPIAYDDKITYEMAMALLRLRLEEALLIKRASTPKHS